MKRATTTLKLYLDDKWSNSMTIDDFLKNYKNNNRIERVYITESVSRKEALELLEEFEEMPLFKGTKEALDSLKVN